MYSRLSDRCDARHAVVFAVYKKWKYLGTYFLNFESIIQFLF